jgi:hypothetical protein
MKNSVIQKKFELVYTPKGQQDVLDGQFHLDRRK